jgi:release factor glutamine methyltransferase
MNGETERHKLQVEVQALLAAHEIPDACEEAREILAFVERSAGATDALALAEARCAGTPLAYVLGQRRFMGLWLKCERGALIPRPETELLGNAAVAIIAARSPGGDGIRVIDVCCGSGNLACGIGCALPGARIWATDLTEDCVALARANVGHLGLGGRVSLCQGDLFEALHPTGLCSTTDVVVCNPPYISSGRLQGESAGLLAFEPREAFDAGPYGLSIHQRVVADALAFLRPGGHLLMEIGLGQERQVARLFERRPGYQEFRFLDDPTGHPRVVVARTAQGE